MGTNVKNLLKVMMEKNASDMHITANSPIHLRIDEKLIPIDKKKLSPEEAKEAIYSILTEEQKKKFEKDLELDFDFLHEDRKSVV